MKIEKWILVTVALTGFLILPSQTMSAQKFLTMTTGATGGTYYITGGGLANLLSKIEGIRASAEVSGGSIENVRRLNSQENDLGWVEGSIAYMAYNGIRGFERHSKIGGITMAYANVAQILTLKEYNIKTFAGIKGKTVGIGPPGGSTEKTAIDLLKAYGLSLKDITPRYVSRGEAIKAMRDGNLHVNFESSGIPTSTTMDLASTHNLSIIPVEKAMLKKLPPYFLERIIPAKTYKGVDMDVPSVEVPVALVAKSSLPEDLAYRITKAIFENLDYLVSIHPAMKQVTLQTATVGMPVPLHPGARKYFQEKGVKLP